MNKIIKKIIRKTAPEEEISEVNTDIQIEEENATTEPVEPVEKLQDNYRECSCGALVPLPDGSAEEFTICPDCGVKHIR